MTAKEDKTRGLEKCGQDLKSNMFYTPMEKICLLYYSQIFLRPVCNRDRTPDLIKSCLVAKVSSILPKIHTPCFQS